MAGREDDWVEDGQEALTFDDALSPDWEEAVPPGGEAAPLGEDVSPDSTPDDLASSDREAAGPGEEAHFGEEAAPAGGGASSDGDTASPEEVFSPGGSPNGSSSPDLEDTWESFTAEDYVQTATQEYADLAAAVAAAEQAEAPEQAAIAADMPGFELSVSLDDVVAVEGIQEAEGPSVRSDLPRRVITGLGLVALLLASLTYRWSIGLLVLAVMIVASGELATTMVRRGYHPVALFSYLGTIGVLVGTWIYGPVAIPVAVAATVLVVILFFGLVTGRQEPLPSMALTVLPVIWVGAFGAFAYELIEAADYQWLVLSLVVIVAGMDIAAYFVGKRIGKRPLAPVVSPKKTVAGLVGGIVAAVGLGYGLSYLAPFDWQTGLILGGALAVIAPLGDLAVSVLKRAMYVKDMGTILPGHGGVIDRIDAILFAVPAAWAVFAWAGLLV